jgi:hypothetical protein
MWNQVQANLAFDSAGRLHAAVADFAHPGALVHLTHRSGTWHRTEVATGAAGYSSVATGPDGRVYLAYIGPDTTHLSDANSVFLVRSPDGGRTWSSPRLISRSGRRQATEVRALVAPDGTLHLVWSQNLSGGLRAEVARHVFSRDRGETWSAPDDLDAPDGFAQLRAVVDRCGSVHVVYTTLSTSPKNVWEYNRGVERWELWYAYWHRRWQAPQSPFASLNSLDADLVAARGGPLYLLWSARPASVIGREPLFVPTIATLEISVHNPS